VVQRLQYYRARLLRHFGHVTVVTPTLGISTTRDVIVVSFLLTDDVSATPDRGEGHPRTIIYLVRRRRRRRQVARIVLLLRSTIAVSVVSVRRSVFRSFHDRPAPQLNASLPPALTTGAHVRDQTRLNALITIFCT